MATTQTSMPKQRPYVLSLAGFDPSAGAGLAADLKTFERLKVYGLGVCTALTVQDEAHFESVEWVNWDLISAQTRQLLARYPVQYAKIGLIEDQERLTQLISLLHELSPGIRIILDPILKASAGKRFHAQWTEQTILSLADQLFLLTPNWEEMQALVPKETPLEAAGRWSEQVHVYLKGGHHPSDPGRDYLHSPGGKAHNFRPRIQSPVAKHGSGCVFSAALTAYLAREFSLVKACFRAKSYVSTFLGSNATALGYHSV